MPDKDQSITADDHDDHLTAIIINGKRSALILRLQCPPSIHHDLRIMKRCKGSNNSLRQRIRNLIIMQTYVGIIR
jgi:hypothetical protein